MRFVADFHTHSYLSRATSKLCDLPNYAAWARRKGIALLGTGDFTHPEWFDQISTKLKPAEPGLFALRKDAASEAVVEVPPSCTADLRYILTSEISNIYKRDGKTRKVHNLLFAPDIETVARINKALDKIGNIKSDGRPILGLDSRDLLEIVLEASSDAFLIPAHIWTPWFSVLGSKSGFDAIEHCYADLSDHIFALETGLSSDPAMNWRLSGLDRYTLVSNSDAHSPGKLAREANLFDCNLDYFAVREAMKTREGFLGTIEFFPEEGKYHFDGHRKCDTRLDPRETIRLDGKCPVCGKPVTVGVSARVEELADRDPGAKPEGAPGYHSLIPLSEVCGEVLSCGPATKKATALYEKLLAELGPELTVLQVTELDQLDRAGGPVLAEAIRRVRTGEVFIDAGYDGEFGTIKIFEPGERESLFGKTGIFAVPKSKATPAEDLYSFSKPQKTKSAIRKKRP
jgi:ATP-dependent DNA helicase UvrD/PcrA